MGLRRVERRFAARRALGRGRFAFIFTRVFFFLSTAWRFAVRFAARFFAGRFFAGRRFAGRFAARLRFGFFAAFRAILRCFAAARVCARRVSR